MKSDVVATTWDTQGEMGYWLSIGFGSQGMNGADVVLCSFKYTNQPNVDKFFCTDRFSTGPFLPDIDTTDNVDDTATTATFSTVGSDRIAYLEATFTR